MHISLDGFVAGPNGEMNWIAINDEIFEFVSRRITKGNTSMYGRVTFDMMEAYWPTAGEKPHATNLEIQYTKWYKGVRKVVISNTLQQEQRGDVKVVGSDLQAEIQALRNEEGEDILLFGSPSTTHVLMQKGLIDGYWLFVNPIILGEGIPLFSDIQESVKLKLLNTTQFNCGVTELNYVVEREHVTNSTIKLEETI